MKLHKIHIGNYRGFEKKVFELHPTFNVFIGDNGSGKTSFLGHHNIALTGKIILHLSRNSDI